MDIEQLRQLEAVARTGTVSAAAAELRVSQPALSRSIRRLERELGCDLFDRSGKRVELNAAGEAALGYARLMLGAERQMRDALADIASRARALHVASVAPAPLLHLTALLVEGLPGTPVSSTLAGVREVEAAVLDGGADLGISARPHVLPAVRSRLFMSERLSVSLPQGHALSERPSVGMDDLDGETFLLNANIGFWRERVDGALPHSQLVVQDGDALFFQAIRTTDLPFFVTDAPAFRAEVPGRVEVPIRDTLAKADYYLLVSERARETARGAFDYVASL